MLVAKSVSLKMSPPLEMLFTYQFGAIWSQRKIFWQDFWMYLHVFFAERMWVSLKRDFTFPWNQRNPWEMGPLSISITEFWIKFYLKVPQGGGANPEKTLTACPLIANTYLEEKIQCPRWESNPHPPTLMISSLGQKLVPHLTHWPTDRRSIFFLNRKNTLQSFKTITNTSTCMCT